MTMAMRKFYRWRGRDGKVILDGNFRTRCYPKQDGISLGYCSKIVSPGKNRLIAAFSSHQNG
jgi:hypothetical protein